MFQDELRGVGFVLAVTDIHLKLVSLSGRKKKFKASVHFLYELYQSIFREKKFTQVTKQWPTSSGSCSYFSNSFRKMLNIARTTF